MDIKKIKSFEQEFFDLKPTLDKFKDSIIVQIEKLLEIENVPLGFPIQKRTKEWNSISDKIKSGRYSIKKTVLELQDLVGLRIILLFNRDVQKVCNLLSRNLNVIKQYNTIERLKEDQFGYNSIHFVVTIPEEWKNVPTLKGLDGFKAEIQVRTLPQHTWAEASKELQYKQEQNVPKPLLRSIGRISALLETVDLEFERLLTERENYKQNINIEIADNFKLNVDNLELLLDKLLPIQNKDLSEEQFDQLLDELNYLHIGDKKGLEMLVSENLPAIIKEDKAIVQRFLNAKGNLEIIANTPFEYDAGRTKKGVYFSHAGLLRNMFERKYPKQWKEYAKKVLKI